MNLLDLWPKFLIVFLMVGACTLFNQHLDSERQESKTALAMQQMHDYNATHTLRAQHTDDNNTAFLSWAVVAALSGLLFLKDIRQFFGTKAALALAVLLMPGCYRQFEPIKLEVIHPNEEAFLLPFTADGKKQQASDNEAYLKANLVYVKQIQIPQQWVPSGFSSRDGKWQDAALLVKVDKSPVTREWTADPNTGTANFDQAIWCMSADQVEFSTGWTCTARISAQDDAVKFLHNYPNGSLAHVMDTEMRAKLQSTFGLAVTDLPMDELQKATTPHILKTAKDITEFFTPRGITITNLGITGGFVYKDKKILDRRVAVFNAEQEKLIAAAETAAQFEHNKKIILKAEGEAQALLKTKKAEADGIKMVVDARQYELDRVGKDTDTYVAIKRLELQKEYLAKWNGQFPTYYMSTGGQGDNPSIMLQLPAIEATKSKEKH